MPPQHLCLVPLSVAPLAFPQGAGGGHTEIMSSPQPSSTTLCRIAQFHDQTRRPMLTTSRSWPLIPASWRPRRGVNQLCSSLVRWADGKQLAIATQKSGVTLFTSDTHLSDSSFKCESVTGWPPWNRTPKILGVTLNTHFTFAPHARDCVEQASRALNVIKALAESNMGITTETFWPLTRPSCETILNYVASI